MPGTIRAAIAAGLATLHELQTVYSVEDVYDMLEIRSVEAHNQALIDADRERE